MTSVSSLFTLFTLFTTRGYRRMGAKLGRFLGGVGVAAGAAAVTVLLGTGAAHADDDTDGSGTAVTSATLPSNINGWALTPGDDGSVTVSDPNDIFGAGTTFTAPSVELSNVEFSGPSSLTEQLAENMAISTGPGSDPFVTISDQWTPIPGLGMVTVTNSDSAADSANPDQAFVLAAPGHMAVDILNIGPDSADAPLFNPDATEPVNVGGLTLASPHDGALLNDLFDAAFKGDTADWAKAEALYDDLLGVESPDGGATGEAAGEAAGAAAVEAASASSS